MNRYFSDDSRKELAMLFRTLKASGYANRGAGQILGVPWITLYKWTQRYLNVSRFDANPKIAKLLNLAGDAMAKARSLPIQRKPRREKPMTLKDKMQAARTRRLVVEAFIAVRARGHGVEEASQMIGYPPSTLARWKRHYEQGGLKNLVPYAAKTDSFRQEFARFPEQPSRVAASLSQLLRRQSVRA